MAEDDQNFSIPNMDNINEELRYYELEDDIYDESGKLLPEDLFVLFWIHKLIKCVNFSHYSNFELNFFHLISSHFYTIAFLLTLNCRKYLESHILEPDELNGSQPITKVIYENGLAMHFLL